MNNARDLIFDLDAFTGSLTQYSHKLPLTSELRLTEGAKHFADTMGAYWLMDIIATEFLELLSEENPIIFISITVDSANGALIVATDGDKGDGPVTLHTRHIEYTDLPRMETPYRFFLQDGVLMLPGEY